MTIGFFSDMTGLPWGGSEELWSRAALRLLARGHDVHANYAWWPESERPDPLSALGRAGAQVHFRARFSGLRRLARSVRLRLGRRLGWAEPLRHRRWLRRAAPDLVLISKGGFHAFPAAAEACRALGIPYALLVHNADPAAWIGDARRSAYRRNYEEAAQCFFVSAPNREVAELNLGIELPEARVVDNPLLVDGEVQPWPAPEATADGEAVWRLACVGRLHFGVKAQDVIVRVLRREKWRRRPMEVSFYGRDHGNGAQLRALIRRHGLGASARVAGFTPRAEIWARNHALLLPSRYEGMPMVTLEAMRSGRVPVVTRCGRNGALVDDGETGFLAAAATPDLLDDAMERAWQRRRDGEAIGREAARRARRRYSATPVEDFADVLEHLAARSADHA